MIYCLKTDSKMEVSRRDSWKVCGYGMNKSQVVYFSQIIIIYIIIITCILNLSLNNGDSNLWTALLSCCIGYILPSPKIKKTKKTEENNSDVIENI